MSMKLVLREREIEVLNNLTGIWTPQREMAKKKFKMAEQHEDATLKYRLKCLIAKIILFKLL